MLFQFRNECLDDLHLGARAHHLAMLRWQSSGSFRALKVHGTLLGGTACYDTGKNGDALQMFENLTVLHDPIVM
jgi:hypothetical protein